MIGLPEIKLCGTCNYFLCVEEFNWKIRGILRQSFCRECSKAYQKNHYRKNKRYYVSKSARQRVERQEAYAGACPFCGGAINEGSRRCGHCWRWQDTEVGKFLHALSKEEG